jgi:formate dehydrogenase subunit gamma
MADVGLDDLIAAHADREGPLLPLLHDVQARFGHVSEAAIRAIAQTLNLTRAEVHGVVSFYHDFKAAPDPRPVLKLYRAEACKARGVEALVADAGAIGGQCGARRTVRSRVRHHAWRTGERDWRRR